MSDIFLHHPVILQASSIADLCRPLKKLEITYFGHVRVKNDYTISLIANNPDFFTHYVKNKYYNVDSVANKDLVLGQYIIWNEIECYGLTAKMDQEAREHGLRHTFTIIKKNKEWTDYYNFSCDLSGRSMSQVYLTNLDLLELFIEYFGDKVAGSKKLNKAYDLQLNIDNDLAECQVLPNQNFVISASERSQFINSLTVGKLRGVSKRLSISSSPTLSKSPCLRLESFSKREVECIYLTVRGKSAKQISNELKISRRTVEEYLTNIKVKMGVYTKSELIDNAINLFE